jgi:hypothetical protein
MQASSLNRGVHLASGLLVAATLLSAWPALAQNCTRNGPAVTCNDGRTGVFDGQSIIWPDGTKSSAASQHPSVIIGNRSSVQVGPGVLVGKGQGGSVPLDNPNSAYKKNCAILEGVSYCH